MHARKRFVIGLALIDLGVLILGWFTWCVRSDFSYSWTSPIGKFVKGIFARVDFGDLFLTVAVTVLVSAGVFFCVDALVWSRHQHKPGDRPPPPPSPPEETGTRD